jgi:adenosylcobinamide kinase / adenosylcobinamide-phosphate guanylyltransferase
MITLIEGPSNSGKSEIAEKEVKKINNPVIYIGTLPVNNETKIKIKKHKLRRPSDWELLENIQSVNELIDKAIKPIPTSILLDGFSVFLTNMLINYKQKSFGYEEYIAYLSSELDRFIIVAKRQSNSIWIVANSLNKESLNDNILFLCKSINNNLYKIVDRVIQINN